MYTLKYLIQIQCSPVCTNIQNAFQKYFYNFSENASCFVWEQTHTSFMYKITVRPLD